MAENEPLLVLGDAEDGTPDEQFPESRPPPKRSSPVERLRSIGPVISEHFKKWKNMYLCAWLIVALEIPLFMCAAPSIQLLENVVCYKLYGKDVDRDMCQNVDVQTHIAQVKGILSVMAGVPGLLLAVPYGMLADRKGRKFVVGLTVASAFCCYVWSFCIFYFYETLPFALIYIYPLFLWVGGGGYVAGSIITAIAAEVVPSEDVRTRAFFFLGVVGKLIGVVAPPLGAQIMHFYGPYVAYFISIPMAIVPAIPLILLPETAKLKDPDEATDDDATTQGPAKPPSLKSRILEIKQHILTEFVPLLKSIPVLIGLFSMTIGSFAIGMMEIIMQYMKARYGWSYEKSTNVIAFSAALQILFLCTLLPLGHKFLTNRFETRKADLVLCKISLPFECVSSFIFGLSATPVGAWIAVAIGNFGLGFGGAMRSYMTALVPKQDVALLYTLIGTAGAIGAMLGSPLAQLSLAIGIRAGGLMVGLPFYIVGAAYGLNTLLVWCLRTPTPQPSEEENIPAEGDIRI